MNRFPKIFRRRVTAAAEPAKTITSQDFAGSKITGGITSANALGIGFATPQRLQAEKNFQR